MKHKIISTARLKGTVSYFVLTILICTFAYLQISTSCFSQNLVPNPGFETGTTCPGGFGFFQLEGHAGPWQNAATMSYTPDYYKIGCTGGGNHDIPCNDVGTEPERTGGNAYAGLITYNGLLPLNAEYREYIQIQLTTPLTAGTVTVSFYASCAEGKVGTVCASLFAGISTKVGAYLSATAPSGDATPIAATPQIISATTIDATTGWTQVTGTFIAAGGEQWITIGNFSNDAATITGNGPIVTSGPVPKYTAYYYIDDVSVIQGALPIQLLSFTANCSPAPSSASGGVGVRCAWQTATETNNDYFTIERAASPNPSKGGALNWEVAGTVKGAGNSTTTRSYEFIDPSPLPFGEGSGVGYYRLTQTDFDGKSETFNSNLVAVDVTECAVKVFPNPLSGNTLNVPYVAEQDGEITLEVYDVIGKLVEESRVLGIKGNNKFTLDLSSVAQGMYVLKVQTGVKEQNQKFIKSSNQ